jgi:predicted LPLAT superfamily acyltransferase
MSSWQGKTRGGKIGYWFFIQILKFPGIRFAYFFLNFVSSYFVVFVAKARKPIFWYFTNIHNYSKLKALRLTFNNFYVFGQVIIDKVALMAGFANKFTFNFDGEEHIQQMAENEGGLLIGAHVGNWEIAGHLLKRIKTKVHIVMLEAEHENIKEMLDDVMAEKKMNIIAIKNDFSHLFKIKKALENNEIVAIHGDRFLPGTNTTKRKFFGKEAEFPLGPFLLAVKYKKPVSFVNAFKESSTHYHFLASKPVHKIAEATVKGRNNATIELLDKYIATLENMLKKYPKQWFNYYYFWG